MGFEDRVEEDLAAEVPDGVEFRVELEEALGEGTSGVVLSGSLTIVRTAEWEVEREGVHLQLELGCQLIVLLELLELSFADLGIILALCICAASNSVLSRFWISFVGNLKA